MRFKGKLRIQMEMAWRNIWRNVRRTVVILMAVIIGVWSMLMINALMRGMAVGMVQNGIATLTGHIQVHQKGYRDDPAVENSIADPAAVYASLNAVLPGGAHTSMRVRVNGIAANARNSAGVTIVGIDPAAEAHVSFIKKAVSSGRYLDSETVNGILVGQALLDQFDTKLGRKLVLMSQDTEKEIASRAFRIVGTYQAEMEATEKQFVFILRPAAQKMLKLGNRISEISILLPQENTVAAVSDKLKTALEAGEYEVHTWQELLPFLRAYLGMLDGFIFIWCLVIFIAMAFGIINTTLMSIFERIREFGLFKALGMKPGWIIRAVLTETFLLLVIGMLIGNGLAVVCVLGLSGGVDLSALAAGAEFAGITRIIYPVLILKDWAVANLIVMVLGLLVSLYPAAVKAARFTPVEALAHT